MTGEIHLFNTDVTIAQLHSIFDEELTDVEDSLFSSLGECLTGKLGSGD